MSSAKIGSFRQPGKNLFAADANTPQTRPQTCRKGCRKSGRKCRSRKTACQPPAA
ncbi:hypothetical protein GW781_00875 [bacterium]|nr:hypothetical protein [bacterium]NCT19687.1 hypothetical protein [bacterium]